MIQEIKLQNFKCFKDLNKFEFSRLNLLTGINGRGKSTLLQSILLLSQSAKNTNLITKLKLNGLLINLGNYNDIKNSETPREEKIKVQMVFKDSISATLNFIENEKDEFSAILEDSNFEVKEEYFDELDDVLKDFVGRVNSYMDEHVPESGKYIVDNGNLVFTTKIKNLHYISADRLGPVKYVDKISLDGSEFYSVGSRGEHSINILASDDLPLVNEMLYLGKDSKSVLQQTQEWLNYVLDGAIIGVEGREQNSSVLWMLINNKSNSYKYKPSNVGFGYSYILPLIVSGLIAQPGEILIVENPEAHLHPRAQSKISEFFARVASTGVQIFIESHSEHILNGLRVSALKSDIGINHNDLAIHYFNESFGSEKLVMDEKGKIPNWPNGFFDQQEIDLAEIFRHSR